LPPRRKAEAFEQSSAGGYRLLSWYRDFRSEGPSSKFAFGFSRVALAAIFWRRGAAAM